MGLLNVWLVTNCDSEGVINKEFPAYFLGAYTDNTFRISNRNGDQLWTAAGYRFTKKDLSVLPHFDEIISLGLLAGVDDPAYQEAMRRGHRNRGSMSYQSIPIPEEWVPEDYWNLPRHSYWKEVKI